MKQFFSTSRIILLVTLFVCTGTPGVWAHNFVVGDLEISGVGTDVMVGYEHADQEDWKGWFDLTVRNIGTEAWGDFHFQIFQVFTHGIDNVYFDVDAPNQPTSSQGGMTWTLSSDGHLLDLFFYDDPVMPNETANFRVYTDNTTDQNAFFGVSMYPTPVPVPPAFVLLASGLAALIGWRKRRQ